jgi:hypothetical protein
VAASSVELQSLSFNFRLFSFKLRLLVLGLNCVEAVIALYIVRLCGSFDIAYQNDSSGGSIKSRQAYRLMLRDIASRSIKVLTCFYT